MWSSVLHGLGCVRAEYSSSDQNVVLGWFAEAVDGLGGVGGFDRTIGGGFDLHDRVDADPVSDGEAAGLLPTDPAEFHGDGIPVVLLDQPGRYGADGEVFADDLDCLLVEVGFSTVAAM